MVHLYRAINVKDFDDYYRIKADKTAILWSGFASAPDKGKLREHFLKLLDNKQESILLYLKEDDTEKLIGYDLMTRIDDETVLSSGHSILSEFQGKGYGTLLFGMLVQYARDLGYKKFIGWISENNIGSIKNVERNGFYRTDDCRKVRLEAFDREDTFYKYECIL